MSVAVFILGMGNISAPHSTSYYEDDDDFYSVPQSLLSGWGWSFFGNKAYACGGENDLPNCYSSGPGIIGGSYWNGGGNYEETRDQTMDPEDPEDPSDSNESTDPNEPVNTVSTYNNETVSDVITSLVTLKNKLQAAKVVSGLSDEAVAKIANDLSKVVNAIDAANIYLSIINSGTQAAIHAAEGQFIQSIAEITALAAGLAAGGALVALGAATIPEVVLSFAAGVLVEYTTEEFLETLGDIYDMHLEASAGSSRIYDDLICSFRQTSEVFCQEP